MQMTGHPEFFGKENISWRLNPIFEELRCVEHVCCRQRIVWGIASNVFVVGNGWFSKTLIQVPFLNTQTYKSLLHGFLSNFRKAGPVTVLPSYCRIARTFTFYFGRCRFLELRELERKVIPGRGHFAQPMQIPQPGSRVRWERTFYPSCRRTNARQGVFGLPTGSSRPRSTFLKCRRKKSRLDWRARQAKLPLVVIIASVNNLPDVDVEKPSCIVRLCTCLLSFHDEDRVTC